MLAGWFIKYNHVTWPISGYNTSSKAERDTYDIGKLCNYTGNFVFVLAGLSFIIALAITVLPRHSEEITVIGIITYAIAVVIGLVYLNTGNRLKKE